MNPVRPKKHLGQHFLKDEAIAQKIVESLNNKNSCDTVLEVGPGMGVLTKYLIKEKSFTTHVIEVDKESIEYLEQHYPELKPRIIHADFLKSDLKKYFPSSFALIGNFPYNISSQILFKVLECRDQIPLVVGMFQKEVAERIAAGPGTKVYGILSVLMKAFYDIEYLFTVNENVFSPPPKVKSGVLRITRNLTSKLECNEDLFLNVVKTAFNQRRKMLRNALSKFNIDEKVVAHPFFSLRAERLSVQDFVDITNLVDGISPGRFSLPESVIPS